MRFKLFGTEFYISFLFSAVITAMLAFDRTGYALPLIFAVVMHEGGHLLVMWILDCPPKRVRLVPAAVEITTAFGCSRKKEIAVALAGPAVNLVLFFTLWFNFLAYKNDPVLVCALINLLIFAFNMLPVTGLDGGTVLFSLLTRRKTRAYNAYNKFIACSFGAFRRSLPLLSRQSEYFAFYNGALPYCYKYN